MPRDQESKTVTVDEELRHALELVGAGDAKGLDRLYQMTSPKLFGICVRICRDYQAAEDTLNDVYLSIWQRKNGFAPTRGRALPWLCTMARNRSIDWVRRNGRPTESDAQLVSMPTLDPDPESLALSADQSDQLHLCLEKLKPRQRAAIETAFFEGVTYSDLADRQSVPLGTMKTWVRRGLLSLRDCLDGR